MAISEDPITLTVHGEHRDGVVRLFARGELDISTAPLLQEWFETVDELQPSAILVDFGDLSFMDSSGLQTLLRAHQHATGQQRVLFVLNGSKGVRRVFELTNTDHLFTPEVSAGASVASMTAEDGEWFPIPRPGADGG